MPTANAWRCTVCGYVHRGPEPPDECPVCGSPKELFEPYADPADNASKPAPKAWQCLVCNYRHTGNAPPEACPVCATPGKQFEAASDEVTAEEISVGDLDRFIVVGTGIAGISAVESIRQSAPRANIKVLTKDKRPPYYRLNLTRYLAGELSAEQLSLHDVAWFRQENIDFLTDSEVAGITVEKRELTLTNGDVHPYDKLILTAGAHPYIPPIAGTRREGITTLRNFDDAEYILEKSRAAQHIAIVGGGVLGLEAAGALANRKREVVLLESFEWLMPRQLNQAAAQLLEKHIKSIGVSLKTNVQVQELVGDERVAGVLLKSGETIPADLVIITAGVRSNSYLARLAGLQVNQGIIVNDFMQTSDPGVYAAGDIAEHRSGFYGLWNAAQYQGSIAGMNAAGKRVEFGGIPRSNTLKVLGVDLLSIGRFEAEDGGDTVIDAECEGNYLRFVFRDSHLVGSILYGDTSISGKIKHAIEKKTDLSGLLAQEPDASGIWDFFKSRK